MTNRRLPIALVFIVLVIGTIIRFNVPVLVHLVLQLLLLVYIVRLRWKPNLCSGSAFFIFKHATGLPRFYAAAVARFCRSDNVRSSRSCL